MNVLASYAMDYARQKRGSSPLHLALSSFNYILAAKALVMGFLFWGPADFFLRPQSPPNELWVALSYLQIEIWDILFPIGGLALIVATTLYRQLVAAHLLLAFVWGLLGVIWTTHGMISPPTEFFGIGIIGIFMSALHIVAVRLWSVERES